MIARTYICTVIETLTLNLNCMAYSVMIFKVDDTPDYVTYVRESYGDALDLFKQKCAEYAAHASMVAPKDSSVSYCIRLTDIKNEIRMEVDIRAKRSNY